MKRLFSEHPDTIVLGESAAHVVGAIGLIAQPWYMEVASLAVRRHQAVSLLREAVAQLGVLAPLELLGVDAVVRLAAYPWPRGLHEIREASHRFGALLEGGNVSAAGRRLDVSRQAVSKYLNRRLTF